MRSKICHKDGISRQDSELVWLELEARFARRMELQGKILN
jgi:hypothetical protein